MTGLALKISRDRLSAELVIPAGEEPHLDEVKRLVAEHGVRHGIDAQALAHLSLDRREQRLVIARGTPPQGPRPASLSSQLPIGDDTVVVEPEMVVGTWVLAQPPHDGMGVDGSEIPYRGRDRAETHPVLGPGLERRGDQVVATRTGWLVRNQAGLHFVAPEHLECRHLPRPEIVVGDDGMEAVIELPAGAFSLPADVRAQMEAAKIVYGLDPAAIRATDTIYRQPRRLVIARGKPPVAGENAWVEYLIDDRASFEVKADGSLDFREAHKVKEVAVGAELARCHLETAGVAGMTVCGTPVEPEGGKGLDFNDFVGEGVTVAPHNELLLIAERVGVFSRDPRGRMFVQELLVIDGDVDLHSGNVETRFPVLIRGDIKDGFAVKSQADITVEGVIEDARVSAQGNLAVGKGILPGQHRVKAHGDITTLYANGRLIKGRNIYVGKDVRHCHLEAAGMVQAQEILGGTVTAADRAIAEALGTEGEEATLVRVGVHPWKERLYDDAVEERERLKLERARAHEALKKNQALVIESTKKLKMLQSSQGLKDKVLDHYRRRASEALASNKEVSAELKAADMRIEELDQTIDELYREGVQFERRAWVTVNKIAYGRVSIAIGRHATRFLSEALGPCTFKLIDGEIVAE